MLYIIHTHSVIFEHPKGYTHTQKVILRTQKVIFNKKKPLFWRVRGLYNNTNNDVSVYVYI